jgi:hypothetical protein
MAAFYSATAHLVSWLGSLPHASQWVAGQTLDDPTTWTCSALSTLKQLHDNLLTLYNCSEWAPPPPAGPAAAPAPDAPAQGHDADNAHPLSRLIFSLLCVLGRMRKMVKTLFVRRYLRNVRSLNGSCNTGRCTSLCSEIRLRIACAMCTCCIVPKKKAPPWVGSRSPDGWDQIPYRPGGWILHQPPWSFGLDSQTRGTRENRRTLC